MSSRTDVDTVVVGSGFGGAPVAYRLAAKPATGLPARAGTPVSAGLVPAQPGGGEPQLLGPERRACYGLFNPWSFRHLEAVVSSGLGGGSLIYANVLMRKDENWFEESDPPGWHWPVTLRGARAVLRARRGDARRRRRTRSTGSRTRRRRRRGRCGTRADGCGTWCPSVTRPAARRSRSRSRPPARAPALGRADPRAGEAEPPRQPRYTLPARAASATSAATSAPRTRSTTTTSAPPSAPARDIRTLCEVRQR